MDPDSDALERISRLRDCTTKRARRVCSLVQSRQDDPTSSAREIADALAHIRKKDFPESIRSLTKWSRKVTDGDVDPEREESTSDTANPPSSGGPSMEAGSTIGGKKKASANVERFEGAEDHQAFIDWVDRNGSRGYVLNLRGEEENPILHSARCSHLRPDPKEDVKSTTHSKLCSKSEGPLRKQAQKIPGQNMEYCSYCDV